MWNPIKNAIEVYNLKALFPEAAAKKKQNDKRVKITKEEMNWLEVDSPIIEGNRITYTYKVVGPWNILFPEERSFWVEYDFDLTGLPESIAIIPLLGALLPCAWIENAPIKVREVDHVFLSALPEFRRGYVLQYNALPFETSVSAKKKVRTKSAPSGTSHENALLFNGGINSLYSLMQHKDEKPLLISVQGADISLKDADACSQFEDGIRKIASDFGSEVSFVKTNFREALIERYMNKILEPFEIDWWTGLQRGLAVTLASAPICWKYDVWNLFVGSPYATEDEIDVFLKRGTFRSSIMNYIRFSGVLNTIDGVDATRQEKVEALVAYAKKNHVAVPLNIKTRSGVNDREEERIFRTMLSLYACGESWTEYGFDYTEEEFRRMAREAELKHPITRELKGQYRSIWDKLHERFSDGKGMITEIRWLFDKERALIGKKEKTYEERQAEYQEAREAERKAKEEEAKAKRDLTPDEKTQKNFELLRGKRN